MEQKKDDYTKFDEKTIATIKASAIWSAVASLIMYVAGALAAEFLFRNLYNSIPDPYFAINFAQPQMINIGILLSSVIWGAIGGAIAGYIIAKFYPVFVDWQKKFLSNKLNSFFKILFWPYLVGLAISLVLSRVMYSNFTVLIIIAVADLASVYIYAKMMDKAVGKYYK